MTANLNRQIGRLLLMGMAISILASCGGEKKRDVFRFIEALEEENVIQSPFLNQVENPDMFRKEHPQLFEMAGEEILLDQGTGDNPLLLKKKMTIGPVDINAILAPPPSRFRFFADIPPDAVLEITYGIRRDRLLETERDDSRTVEFSVVFESLDNRDILLDKKLTLTPDKDLEFNYRSVDLGKYSGQRLEIAFITRGDPDALACWFNPVIYRRRDNPRNVVLISLDTLRPDHLGCYGYPRETSPAIDRLVRDSAVFNQTFSSAPWTLPSHVSMLTALNCINHQVYTDEQKMDSQIVTLADYMKSSGYFTTAVTGGGFVSGLYGFNKGFESYHVQGEVASPDSAERTAADVLNFIERYKDRNFFLFVHTYQIHNPYWSPPEYGRYFLPEGDTTEKYDLTMMGLRHENRYMSLPEETRLRIIDLYDGEIRYTDDRLIRPVVEKLKSLGLYDNTMIVLLSDHGEEFFEHGSWLHTQNLYNETIQVPLIIKFFNNEHSGVRVDKYARTVDVMPTLLEVLGIKYDSGSIDGASLLPLLEEGTERLEERICLSELGPYILNHHIPKKVSITRERNKLIVNDAYTPEDLAFFRFPPPDRGRIEAYDLENDAGELRNKASSDPRLARTLMDFLRDRLVRNKNITGQSVQVSEEIREQLRALGYIR